MPKHLAAQAASSFLAEDDALRVGVVVDLDDVLQRRERLLAYAEATRPVLIYRFVFPEGAKVRALDLSGAVRDARAQLELIVGLTGGGLVKSHQGLGARIPKLSAARFEMMAGPLIEAYLVALDLGGDQPFGWPFCTHNFLAKRSGIGRRVMGSPARLSAWTSTPMILTP
ncbi:hypothetical protein [Caulobacter sp. RL271]|jgi:hypothetical protein|uniref:Uncharacterized protein n=1 Tax=Caulobacter segnis TaxID=88688 RepID=A0ABY4ZT71_9CAUL|nr:hypothetical protein [Caulobacter segnis]USQ95399.1 hypothetical protein MZV50_23095 [Caulobacter segnis]